MSKIDIICQPDLLATMKTTTKPMNVSLTANLESFVRKLVKSGRYNSASEVVRDGLRLVEEREELREIKLQALRHAIQDGLDSGPPVDWSVDEFISRAKKHKSVRSSK